MPYLFIVIALATSYFVEWIPNNASSGTFASGSPGEFPWQLSG